MALDIIKLFVKVYLKELELFLIISCHELQLKNSLKNYKDIFAEDIRNAGKFNLYFPF